MGRDDSRSDLYRYPYEPTPYCVLERMANTDDPKGKYAARLRMRKGPRRFLLIGADPVPVIGVEYDDRIYAKAMENKKAAASGARTEFVLESAENFPVPVEVDRVYFFNPFSLEILRKAMARLLESYYENPREIQLFFYYPSDAYISYLMTVPELEFLDEIDCMDLFPGGDSRERVVIFTIQE